MSWRDRSYNRGGFSGDEYLSNPAAVLGVSVPAGTWGGSTVRLHFWLLLTIALSAVSVFNGASPAAIALSVGVLLASLLAHEFAHKLFARWAGGDHTEMTIWPAGGMVPPRVPPGPGPMFVGNVGGIAANLLAVLVAGLASRAMYGASVWPSLNPLVALSGGIAPEGLTRDWRLYGFGFSLAETVALINGGIVAINLLPYYWFDGGYLWQSILWRFTNVAQAVNITCIAGMVIAVPMFALSMAGRNLLSMIFWALLFASAYSKRKQGDWGGDGGEYEPMLSYGNGGGETRQSSRRRRRPWQVPGAAQRQLRAAVKRRAEEAEERLKVDAILAKVSAQGMHSLTSKEQRTLRQASENQKKRDAARGKL